MINGGSPSNPFLTATVVTLLLVSAIFYQVVQSFLIALTLAGICAVLARPLFLKIKHLVGGREGLASGLTLLVCVIAGVAPIMLITYQAASQACLTSALLGPNRVI